MITIPPEEITIEFARSSGPGGQNVNKTSTKAVLHWCVGASRYFSLEQKNRLRHLLKNRLNKADEIVLSAKSERSQFQNKQNALAELNRLIARALIIPKKRRPTRPTFGSKVRRLESKSKRSEVKRRRQGFAD